MRQVAIRVESSLVYKSQATFTVIPETKAVFLPKPGEMTPEQCRTGDDMRPPTQLSSSMFVWACFFFLFASNKKKCLHHAVCLTCLKDKMSNWLSLQGIFISNCSKKLNLLSSILFSFLHCASHSMASSC